MRRMSLALVSSPPPVSLLTLVGGEIVWDAGVVAGRRR
jgi:hypothetical protein